MKELLLNRNRVKCYSTETYRELDGQIIELYASTSSYDTGTAKYYVDSDVDCGSVIDLGTFESFSQAEKAFDEYCES